MYDPCPIVLLTLGGGIWDHQTNRERRGSGYWGNTVLVKSTANDKIIEKEVDRKEEVTNKLENITYQSARVQELQKYPSNVIIEVLQAKCLDLMTAMTGYLTWSLKYFQHGFFRTNSSQKPLVIGLICR
jgi:hypothetical protein